MGDTRQSDWRRMAWSHIKNNASFAGSLIKPLGTKHLAGAGNMAYRAFCPSGSNAFFARFARAPSPNGGSRDREVQALWAALMLRHIETSLRQRGLHFGQGI